MLFPTFDAESKSAKKPKFSMCGGVGREEVINLVAMLDLQYTGKVTLIVVWSPKLIHQLGGTIKRKKIPR